MVVKFYAPWCRACKAVEPKFIQISKDENYSSIPIVFGQISVQHNKAYVKSLGILALPSIQIYAGSEGLVENFPCGPSKIPMLKRKISETINAKVDPETLMLKLDCSKPENFEAAPCKTRALAVFDESSASNEIDEVISDERKEENLRYLRYEVPFFKDFDDDQFYELMDKVGRIGLDSFDQYFLCYELTPMRVDSLNLYNATGQAGDIRTGGCHNETRNGGEHVLCH